MLYDNAWPSTYEEIRSFYPVWYWDVFEMDAIWRAQGYELDNVRRTIERIIDDGYIATADSDMIAQYEHFLDLPADKTIPLEERRKIVSATLFLILHIGASEIKEIIGIFTDGPVTVTFANGKIGIIVESGEREPPSIDACDALLRKRIPAHLALDLCVHIRQSFRETLHICYGGDVGIAIDAEPANDDRVTVMPVQIAHGGIISAGIEAAPVTEPKTGSVHVFVGTGGRALTEFSLDPVTEPKTGTTDLPISGTGFIKSKADSIPVTENKSETTGLNLAHGGLLTDRQQFIPPDIKKAATGRSGRSVGAYYHTHIKSKLIE